MHRVEEFMQASNSEAATYKALVKIIKIIIIVLPSKLYSKVQISMDTLLRIE